VRHDAAKAPGERMKHLAEVAMTHEQVRDVEQKGEAIAFGAKAGPA
jgi:hypothetical protein